MAFKIFEVILCFSVWLAEIYPTPRVVVLTRDTEAVLLLRDLLW